VKLLIASVRFLHLTCSWLGSEEKKRKRKDGLVKVVIREAEISERGEVE